MEMEELARIRWAPRLRPTLLKRLYDSDAKGFQDVELCDKVGFALYARCHTFALVHHLQVECPECGSIFPVGPHGKSQCPQEGCAWYTTQTVYAQSIRNHYAHTGRAVAAFLSFYRGYPNAKTYKEKMLLIDQLIHCFHIDEKSGDPAKSVASKLLEGNKKAVVQFLDDLSALHPGEKERWRSTVARTIDRRFLRSDPLDRG